MTTVKIDYRERKLCECLSTIDLPFSSQPLAIGDIEICHGAKRVVIERKTVSDFESSIKDGRYKEQKVRLLASGAICAYIVEGFISSKMVRTAIISTQMRDKIMVFYAKNTTETAELIETLVRKADEYFTDAPTTTLVATIKPVKKDNLTVHSCFFAQLCEIPSVSHTIAQAISEKFTSMREFIEHLSHMSQKDRITSLAEMRLESRRIGDVCASKVIEFLGFVDTPTITLVLPD